MVFGSRKGISPLIASVLLVVFTVAIAALIVGWLSTYTRETTSVVSISGKNVIDCMKVTLDIDTVYLTVNSTGSDTIRAVVTNKGQVAINIVSAIAYSSEGTSCALSSQAGSSMSVGSIAMWSNASGCDLYADNSTCSDFNMIQVITDCGTSAVFRSPRTPSCKSA